ncbi:hypothetical protein CLHUN_41100 [Ruminiclostridium hungatei]|uniref:DUF421 domain-containing protein n=1 Tax=Ruminiclostridium hungatei TaxID=48256 RepID=A0A1V4SEQ9_RUMHU|nr:DUF421 domain-containing protein [Ruminiclostridium hungatei]OPX41996.1 hypothetical protein CLHUN_41100 [Ruminiclostridium hungatei]
MNELLYSAIRTSIGFVILLLFTRATGKKQLSQMTIFTYITGITLGSMIGEMVIHGGVEFMEEVLGVILWGVFSFVVEYVALKIPFMRVVLDSEPTIVIKRGEIQVKELRKMRLNMDDLTMLLREKDVFTVRDVWYAILEPHGELSIVKKAAKQPVLMENMGFQPQNPSYLPGELITDGNLITKNLLEFGKTEEWLTQELSKQGITSIKQVFYAELSEGDTLFIQKK